MNFETVIDKCVEDYTQHLWKLKESLNLLNKDKALMLAGHPEADAPTEIKEKIERDKKSWQKEWGIYGSRAQDLIEKHQKEVYKHVRAQEIAKDLNESNEQSKEKSKQNGKGR